MSTKRITAIVPSDILDSLETHLRACGVPGVTVERVQGYGEHPNYFRRDLMKDNVRVLLYADEESVEKIVKAITTCARKCGSRSGIVAVESVDRLVSLGNNHDVASPSA